MKRGDLTSKYVRVCGRCGLRRHISALPTECDNCGSDQWTRNRNNVTVSEDNQ